MTRTYPSPALLASITNLADAFFAKALRDTERGHAQLEADHAALMQAIAAPVHVRGEGNVSPEKERE